MLTMEQGGTFHYHADANCLHWHPDEGETMLDYDISTPAEAVAQNTANGSHSAVIGVAMDGYSYLTDFGAGDGRMTVDRDEELLQTQRRRDRLQRHRRLCSTFKDSDTSMYAMVNFGPTPALPDGTLSLSFNHDERVKVIMGFPIFPAMLSR